MSEMPPIPPQGPGGYFRPSDLPYGSPEKLMALYRGYNGLSIAFAVNVALSLGLNLFLTRAPIPPGSELMVVAVAALIVASIVFALVFQPNRLIAQGKGWGPGMDVLASVLVGLNSALCCGIVGYVVMQQIAYNEMKRYGLRTGFLGVRKKDVEAKVAEMQAAGRMPGFPA